MVGIENIVLYNSSLGRMSSKSVGVEMGRRDKRRSPSFFYKHKEIRFRDLISASVKKLPRPEYVVSNNPWREIKGD